MCLARAVQKQPLSQWRHSNDRLQFHGDREAIFLNPAKKSNNLYSLASSAHPTVLSILGCNAASCLKGLRTKQKLLMVTSMINQRPVVRSRAASLSILLLLAEIIIKAFLTEVKFSHLSS